MIVIIVGGIGSGKTLTSVEQIETRKNFVYCNFALTGKTGWQLLTWNMVITEHLKEKGKPEYVPNYDFWQSERKKHSFDIYVDEVHEVLSSRAGMSRQSQAANKWVSQIRKVLAYDEENNLYFITQRPMALDIHCRELAHLYIYCKKMPLPKDIDAAVQGLPVHNPVVILRYYFLAEKLPVIGLTLEHFEGLILAGKHQGCDAVLANPYFDKYQSHSFVDFGREEVFR